MKKILVVASLTSTCTANYIIRAFKQLGCEVKTSSDIPSELADVVVSRGPDVVKITKWLRYEPDCLLFIEGGSMQLLPTGLEHLPCLTAWYGIDTHMDYKKHLRLGRLFDVTFIAQKRYVELLRRDGLRQVHWLPLAFAQELLPYPMPKREIDIAYVGSDRVVANPQRHALLDRLRKEFQSTRFGVATPAEMGRIYAAAKIVFNKSVNNDVNMRFFEAAGAGAVLVTDRILDNGLDELFEEDSHYVAYDDEASLVAVVRALLADPDRRAAIGESARHRAFERHTYGLRAEAILDSLARSKKLPPPQAEDYFAACLSLDLVSDAVRMAGSAVAEREGGIYRRCIRGPVFLLLNACAAILGTIEWALGRLRQR